MGVQDTDSVPLILHPDSSFCLRNVSCGLFFAPSSPLRVVLLMPNFTKMLLCCGFVLSLELGSDLRLHVS